jgi:hypothetical protein
MPAYRIALEGEVLTGSGGHLVCVRPEVEGGTLCGLAVLLEQNDEWAVQRRYMSLETLEGLSDDPKAKPRRIAAA